MDESAVKRVLDSPPRAAREAAKRAAASLCRLTHPGRSFTFRGREYPYLYHPYNLAWRNERAVEVPIAAGYLEAYRGRAVLEVGNVLSHYLDAGHDVVDMYERAPGVINEDAAFFSTDKRYDLVISVSTLEHVGTYEEAPDPAGAPKAVINLVGLLNPGGVLVATAPLGLNPRFDEQVDSGEIPFEELYAMRKVRRGNRWSEAEYESVRGASYRKSTFRADAIIVGIITKGQV